MFYFHPRLTKLHEPGLTPDVVKLVQTIIKKVEKKMLTKPKDLSDTCDSKCYAIFSNRKANSPKCLTLLRYKGFYLPTSLCTVECL